MVYEKKVLKECLKDLLGPKVQLILLEKQYICFDNLETFLKVSDDFSKFYLGYKSNDTAFRFKIFAGTQGFYGVAWVKEPKGTSYNLVLIKHRWYTYHPKKGLRCFKTPKPGSLVLI